MNNKFIKYLILFTIFAQLFYISQERIKFNWVNLTNSFKKNYKGELLLPKETLELAEIIKRESLNSYKLDNSFLNNQYIYQRTVEYIYPIKINNNLSETFGLKNTKNENCLIIKSYTNINKLKC
tara:strand:- start:123 stop:494 length:372 start_codon:yes stop_codon:yes gene_type:complete